MVPTERLDLRMRLFACNISVRWDGMGQSQFGRWRNRRTRSSWRRSCAGPPLLKLLLSDCTRRFTAALGAVPMPLHNVPATLDPGIGFVAGFEPDPGGWVYPILGN